MTDADLAVRLVTDAGALAARMRAAGLETQQKTSVSDVVTAADLAAVAGATALYGGADPCRAAAETAELNGARVEHCEERAPDVVVTAGVRRSSASARAGPL